MKNSNYRLPKRFFQEHPLDEISFARFSYFKMTKMGQAMLSDDALNDEIKTHLPQERKDLIASENERISKLQTAEEIIDALRKEREIFCRDAIVLRALEMEDAVLPLLLRRFQKNSMDFFLEGAAEIIARAKPEYSEKLFAEYDLIRAPYARAQACLVFAAQKMEQTIPLLLQEVERLGQIKEREHHSDLSQAPLLALHVLCGQPF